MLRSLFPFSKSSPRSSIQRHRVDRPDVRGHVLPRRPVPARRGAREAAVLVDERHREPSIFSSQTNAGVRPRRSTTRSAQAFSSSGEYAFSSERSGISCLTLGRLETGVPPTRCVGESGVTRSGCAVLQRDQLAHERVVFGIADFRAVLDVVQARVLRDFLPESPDAFLGRRETPHPDCRIESPEGLMANLRAATAAIVLSFAAALPAASGGLARLHGGEERGREDRGRDRGPQAEARGPRDRARDPQGRGRQRPARPWAVIFASQEPPRARRRRCGVREERLRPPPRASRGRRERRHRHVHLAPRLERRRIAILVSPGQRAGGALRREGFS